MIANTIKGIKALITSHLKTLEFDQPRKYFNTGSEEFTEPYIEVNVLMGDIDPIGLGGDGKDEVVVIFQPNFYYRHNVSGKASGDSFALNDFQALREGFPVGLQLWDSTTKTQLTVFRQRYGNPSIKDQVWSVYPHSISFRAEILR